MKEKTIRLARIKIPKEFEQTLPRPHKVNRKYYHFYSTGDFDKPVVIDKRRTLVDGYITYLFYRMLGKKKLKVMIQEK